MKELSLRFEKERGAELIGKQAFEVDVEPILPGTIIRDSETNEILLVYGKLQKRHTVLKTICRAIKFTNHRRLTQLMNEYESPTTRDVAFGSRPPNAVFGLAASQCQFNKEAPAWYAEVCELGAELENLFKTYEPEKFLRQQETVAKIHPDWVLPKSTVFTQGVINDANVLGYHYDRDNVPNGFSGMVYFKQKMAGGNLVLPQLGAKLIPEDETFVLFDGQSLIHGVTPLQRLAGKDSWRYSFVFYARQSMVGLASFEEELKNLKKREMELRFRRSNERTNNADPQQS